MCLILFAWQADPSRDLVVAANRDEFYDRPTAKAAFWSEAPEVLAGRDLEAGGTWLGVTRGGRFAAVTNFRAGGENRDGAPSRGYLVGEFLRSDCEPEDYLRDLSANAQAYNGFNLLVGNRTKLCYLSNRCDGIHALKPGVYGLSNHLLDTDWLKVRRGKAALNEFLRGGGESCRERLLSAMADRMPAPDKMLPDTGVGLHAERALSPLFIATPRYGTRCTTLIEKGIGGNSRFYERTYARDGTYSDVAYELTDAAARSAACAD